MALFDFNHDGKTDLDEEIQGNIILQNVLKEDVPPESNSQSVDWGTIVIIVLVIWSILEAICSL